MSFERFRGVVLIAGVPWHCMAIGAIPVLHMQLAFAIALIGVVVGWRGVLTRMTGFYDLSGAVKYLLYGIVAGVLLALAVDRLVLATILLESDTSSVSVPLGFIIPMALLIGALESSFVLFLLGRPGVSSIRASPPFGWALGLGLGSMQAAYLIVRLFDPDPERLAAISSIAGFDTLSISLAMAISVMSCMGHSLSCSWQGFRMLSGSRAYPLAISTIARASLSICLVLCLIDPIFFVGVLPFVVFYWFRAQEEWLPSGLTPAARQAYRRTIRQAELNKQRADDRIRGESVDIDE